MSSAFVPVSPGGGPHSRGSPRWPAVGALCLPTMPAGGIGNPGDPDRSPLASGVGKYSP